MDSPVISFFLTDCNVCGLLLRVASNILYVTYNIIHNHMVHIICNICIKCSWLYGTLWASEKIKGFFIHHTWWIIDHDSLLMNDWWSIGDDSIHNGCVSQSMVDFFRWGLLAHLENKSNFMFTGRGQRFFESMIKTNIFGPKLQNLNFTIDPVSLITLRCV